MKVYGSLEQAALQSNAGDLSGNVTGRIHWDSTALRPKLDDGTNQYALLRNDQKLIIGNNGTAANNVRFNRAAAAVLQLVIGSDTTAEGSLSTSLGQLSSRHENYTDAGKPTFGNAGRLIWVTDLAQLQVDTGSAWSALTAGGSSFPSGNLVVTGTTTLTGADSKKVIKITAQSGGYTITLPAHSANQIFWFKEVTQADVVANPITIARDGGTGEIENVAASYVVRQNNFSFGLFDDGTDWWIL